MPDNTLRRFDDDAIRNIFSVLKYYLVAKVDGKDLLETSLKTKLEALKYTDDIAPVFDGTITTSQYDQGARYWTKGSGATNGNSLAQERIIVALNELTQYLKSEIEDIDISDAYNGTITKSQQTNTYVGTGNAVPATDLDDVLNELLTLINDKFDIDDIDDDTLSFTGLNTAITNIYYLMNGSESERSTAATVLQNLKTNDENPASSSYNKAFVDVASGMTDHLPDATTLALTFNRLGHAIVQLFLNERSLFDTKVDTSKISTAVEVDTTAHQQQIPTNQAVATYVQSAIAGVGGVSFHICDSGDYSGNSETFDGDDGTTASGTVTGTTVYSFTLTGAPKKINFVSLNGQQIQYTYSGSSTHIISIILPSTPALTSTDTVIVNYVPYPTLSETPLANTFYLVPNDGTGTSNIYNEYVWISNTWELIGSTENDFSQYIKYEDLEIITANELASLFTAAPATVSASSQSGS